MMLVSLLELSEVINYHAKLHFEFSSQGWKREGLMCGLLQRRHTLAKGLLWFLLLGDDLRIECSGSKLF